MSKFIIHYLNGDQEEVDASSLQDALKSRPGVSYYEDKKAEEEVKEKIYQMPDEEVELAIVSRVILVPSASEPGKSYNVIVQPNGTIYCPCTGFANRHYCWHSNYIKELLEEEKIHGKQTK